MTGRSALRRWAIPPGRAAAAFVCFLATAALLGACTSDHASRRTSSAASPPRQLSTAVVPLPAAPPTTPSALAAFLDAGQARFGSARVQVATALSGDSLSGSGSLTTDAAGQVTAMDVGVDVNGLGHVHVVLAGGTAYGELPATASSAQPYVVLDGTHGGAAGKSAALAARAMTLLAAPRTYRTLVAAAPSDNLVGRDRLGGVPVLHYRAPIQIAKIDSASPVRIALDLLGVKAMTLDLWVDGAGRPVQATAPTPDGRTSRVAFAAINAPVTITPPPSSQVQR